MGFFGKKGKQPDISNDVSVDKNISVSEQPEDSAKSKKKKKSPMYQIFRESVWETVREDFQKNDAFIHTEKDGSFKYVGIVLDVESIGGLDKRSRKNESKGSMIQVINSGKIKTYITCDLMDENCLMFIPEVITLSEMDNYTLLGEAKYELGFVDMAGNIELLGIYATYKEIVNLFETDAHVDVLLKGLEDESDVVDKIPEVSLDEDLLCEEPKGEAGTSGSDVMETKTEPVSDVSSVSDIVKKTDTPVVSDDDDIEPLDDELEEFNEGSNASGGGSDVTPVASSTPVSNTNAYDQLAVGNYEASMSDESEPEAEDTIPSEWVTDTVTRRFYSNDLGLEVSTEPFDSMFLHENLFAPFDDRRPDGWINDQLNEIAREANSDMSRLHQHNLFIMRERYFKLMATQCDRIQKDLDVSNESTQYGQMLLQLRMSLDDARSDIGILVDKKKTEMEQRWRTKLQEVGMDAAREAQRQYRDRYGKQHDLEIYGIEDAVKASIEADFNDSVHDLYDRRRSEAATMLDMCITEVLDEISNMYIACMEDEQALYRDWQDQMHRFIEDNRQADIARMNVLAEDLRQKERADQVLADQTAKIRTMVQDHNNKRKELMDEIEKLRADNQATIISLKQESSAELEKVRAEKSELEAKFNDLLDKYSNLDAMKDKEYEERMEELRDEVFSWEDKCDHLASVHKRNSLNSVFFVVSAVIAALFIGFVGGEFVSLSRQTKSEYRSIVEDHQKQMDKAKTATGLDDTNKVSDSKKDANADKSAEVNKDGEDKAGK